MYLFRCSLGLEWEEQGISFLLFHLFLFIRFPLRSPFFMPSPNLKKKKHFLATTRRLKSTTATVLNSRSGVPGVSWSLGGWVCHIDRFSRRESRSGGELENWIQPPPVHPAVWTVADRAITAHLGNKAEASPFCRVRLRSTTVVLFNISVCVALSEWYWLLGEAAAGVGGDGQEGCREPSLAVRLRSAAQLLLRQGNRVRTNI